MHENKNAILEGAMRAGYGARGFVYLTIGMLAVFAAVNGGEAEGSIGALNYLSKQPFGVALVGGVAVGFFAFALWRFTDAALDLENEGDHARGAGSRMTKVFSGAAHLFLCATAVTIMIRGIKAEHNSAANWSAAVMSAPFGRWAVALAGIIAIGVGLYFFFKSGARTYRDDLRETTITRCLAPFVRFGLAAHGFVLLIIGGMVTYAGWTTNPDRAVGLGEALALLETQPFGRTLLGLAGAGMVAFAVYCFVLAVYRVPLTITRKDLPESLS